MKLDLFKKIDIDEETLHPKFKILRDTVGLEGERSIVNEWTENFVDRDNKIVKEFQTTFHSSFWEFYLYKVFTNAGFTIDFRYDRPDFIINSPIEVNIEAVVSNIKQNGVSEGKRTLDNILSIIDPPYLQEDFGAFMNESIVRNSNAILSKSNKYLKSYSTCTWIKPETPFIIALSSYGQIDYGREFYYPMLALLYGMYYNPFLDDYIVVNEITKPNTDSSIPVGIFNTPAMEHVSAIIFSCTTTLGKLTSLSISEGNSKLQLNKVINIRHDYEPPHFKVQIVSEENPEELSDGLFMFHNPLAKNKLLKEMFKNTNICHITYEKGKLHSEGENLPIVGRLNIPEIFFTNLLIKEIDQKYNRRN
jgi:hypothetical protein